MCLCVRVLGFRCACVFVSGVFSAGNYGSATTLTSATCTAPCSAGFYCPSGSTSATQAVCGAGTYSLAGAGLCTPCTLGQYQAATGQSTCALCAAGACETRVGDLRTGLAPTNDWLITLWRRLCFLCPFVNIAFCLGYFGAAAGMSVSTCTGACFAGSYCPLGSTSATQLPCAVGQYSAAGATACVSCQAGKYQGREGQASCVACLPGSYGSTTGLLVSNCTAPCTAGYYCPAGATTSTQIICPIGTFSLNGAGSCTPCPPGQYQVLVGQSDCLPCIAGVVPLAVPGPRASGSSLFASPTTTGTGVSVYCWQGHASALCLLLLPLLLHSR